MTQGLAIEMFKNEHEKEVEAHGRIKSWIQISPYNSDCPICVKIFMNDGTEYEYTVKSMWYLTQLEDVTPPKPMYKLVCTEKLSAQNLLSAFCITQYRCRSCPLRNCENGVNICLKSHNINKAIEILKEKNLIVEVKE